MRALLVAAALIALGLGSHAQTKNITVENILIRIGPAAYYSPYAERWRLPVDLAPGESLVLAASRPGNFETSNIVGPYVVKIAVTVDGITTNFEDASGILTLRGLGPQHHAAGNKAQEWGEPMAGPGYTVQVGYADTIHAACGEYASSLGLIGAESCAPAGFFTATYMQHAPAHYVNGAVGYDSGAIHIMARP